MMQCGLNLGVPAIFWIFSANVCKKGKEQNTQYSLLAFKVDGTICTEPTSKELNMLVSYIDSTSEKIKHSGVIFSDDEVHKLSLMNYRCNKNGKECILVESFKFISPIENNLN